MRAELLDLDIEEHIAAIFKGVVFACRYGKADPSSLLPRLTWDRRMLRRWNHATSELLKEEKDAITRTHNTD